MPLLFESAWERANAFEASQDEDAPPAAPAPGTAADAAPALGTICADEPPSDGGLEGSLGGFGEKLGGPASEDRPQPVEAAARKPVPADFGVKTWGQLHKKLKGLRRQEKLRPRGRLFKYVVRGAVVKKYGRPSEVAIKLTAEGLPHANGAWVGLVNCTLPSGIPDAEDVQARGLRLIRWDGR